MRHHNLPGLFLGRLGAPDSILLRPEESGLCGAVLEYWCHGGGAVCVWLGQDWRGDWLEGERECLGRLEGSLADGYDWRRRGWGCRWLGQSNWALRDFASDGERGGGGLLFLSVDDDMIV